VAGHGLLDATAYAHFFNKISKKTMTCSALAVIHNHTKDDAVRNPLFDEESLQHMQEIPGNIIKFGYTPLKRWSRVQDPV